MSVTGLPGQGPVRAGIPYRRSVRRHFRCPRHSAGADGARAVGPGPMGAVVATGGADLHARFPGGALADGPPGAGPGRQQSSVRRADRRVRDQGRAYQYRDHRPGNLSAASATRIGAPSLFTDPLFADSRTRFKNRDKLNAAIEEVTKTKTSAEWIDLFNKAGVPPVRSTISTKCSPIRRSSISAWRRRSTIRKSGRTEYLAQPIKLSRTPWRLHSVPPEKGEHTDEVLRALGYDAKTIADLRARKIVE